MRLDASIRPVILSLIAVSPASFLPSPAAGMDEQPIREFIQRWSNSGGAERANYQLFLAELCDVLQVARPESTVEDDCRNAYVYERNVQFDNLDGTHTTRQIDLYKRGCFVLESKQGGLQQDVAPVLSARQQERRAKRKRGHGTRGTAGWDDAMFRARGQAEQYVRALSPDEGRPPFILVVDVGHSLELYAEFSQTGGTCVPFPGIAFFSSLTCGFYRTTNL